MAPIRETKDERHLKPKRTISPIPTQKKRSFSEPGTLSRNLSASGDTKQKLTPFNVTIHPDYFTTRAGIRQKYRTIVPLQPTRITKPANYKKNGESMRMGAMQGRLEMELTKLMEGVTLKGGGMGDKWRESRDLESRERIGKDEGEKEQLMDMDNGKKKEIEGDVDMECLEVKLPQ